ncbi:TRI66 protein, partial [Polypterus senegalus]|nr:tripartite motif-containing protein 66 [Polypterus senegalus]XP_039604327.1 tripartite motif-containing protein 66 [Polypterus senegalus]XP_039604335.1 tripartite motif-containing protein 66 [Polypterus senegalus]MBN3288997.1 TRI66 protein [Polypterus senegalus]
MNTNCTDCEECRPSLCLCTYCNKKLCFQCSVLHKHEQERLQPQKGAEDHVERFDLFCPFHDHKRLHFFCEKCNIMTCETCHLLSQKDHRVLYVGTALQNQQCYFENVTTQMMNKKTAMKTSAKYLEHRLLEMKLMCRNTENQIKMAKMILISEISKRTNILIDELEKRTNAFKLNLEQQLHGIFDFCKQLEHVQNFINWAMDSNKSAQFIFNKELLPIQMQLLTETHLSTDPSPSKTVTFHWDPNIWIEQISNLGYLSEDKGTPSHQCTIDHMHSQHPLSSVHPVVSGAVHQTLVPPVNEYQLCLLSSAPNCYDQCLHPARTSRESLSLHHMQHGAKTRRVTRLQQQYFSEKYGSLQAKSYQQIMPLPIKRVHAWHVGELQKSPSVYTGSHPDIGHVDQQSHARSFLVQPIHHTQQQREIPVQLVPQTNKVLPDTMHQQPQIPQIQLTHLNQIPTEQQQQQQQQHEASACSVLPDKTGQHSPSIMQSADMDQVKKGLENLFTQHNPNQQLCHSGNSSEDEQQVSVAQQQSAQTHQQVPHSSMQQQIFTSVECDSQGQQPELLHKQAHLQQQKDSALKVASPITSATTSEAITSSLKITDPILQENTPSKESQAETIVSVSKSAARASPKDPHTGATDNIATDCTDQGIMKCKKEDPEKEGNWEFEQPINLSLNKLLCNSDITTSSVPHLALRKSHSEGRNYDCESKRNISRKSTPHKNDEIINNAAERNHKENALVPYVRLERLNICPLPGQVPIFKLHPEANQKDGSIHILIELNKENTIETSEEWIIEKKEDPDQKPTYFASFHRPLGDTTHCEIENQDGPKKERPSSVSNVQSVPSILPCLEEETKEKIIRPLKMEEISKETFDPSWSTKIKSEGLQSIEQDVTCEEEPATLGAPEKIPFEDNSSCKPLSELHSDMPEEDSLNDSSSGNHKEMRSEDWDSSCSEKNRSPCSKYSEEIQDGSTAIENEDFCAVCLNGGDLLCCDRCPKVFHLSCHIPSLLSFPVGEWVCALCRSLEEPEIEYDCENTRLNQDQKGRRVKHGLSALDQRKCEKLTLLVCCNNLSLPFHEPVSPLARHYYQIIKRPIDLSAIQRKLNKKSPLHYYTTEEFVADIQLMFRNCAKFNYPDSEMAQAGRTLELFFKEKLKQIFPEKEFPPLVDESDSEESDEASRMEISEFIWPKDDKEHFQAKRRRRNSAVSRRHQL